MGWNNWPYWIKGGVIGLIIFVIELVYFSIRLNNQLDGELALGLIGISYILPQLLFNIFLRFVLIVGISILIGWIYELIKTRMNKGSKDGK